MPLEVLDKARGHWLEILVALGIPAHHLTGRHCPCPMCGGTDRFRYADSAPKRPKAGVWHCNQCGSGDGIDLVLRSRGLSGFAEAAREVESVLGGSTRAGPSMHGRQNGQSVLRLLRAAFPARPADFVDNYLTSRGLRLPPKIGAHRSVGYYEDGVRVSSYPAMIGTIRTSSHKTIVGAHITYLATVGNRKASVPAPRKIRKVLSSISGAAVQLYPAEPHLGIAEGIETAIAAAMLHNLPVWAALSAQGLASFIPPPDTKHVTVFADNDIHATGQRAAGDLETRLRILGISCDIRTAGTPGTDWADEINLSRNSGMERRAK